MTVAAAVPRDQTDPVAFLDRSARCGGQPFDLAILPDDLDVVGRTWQTSLQRPRRKLRPAETESQERILRAQAVSNLDASAAAEFAFSARIVIEHNALDEDPVSRLIDFGRAVIGQAMEAGEDCRGAVAALVPAPAAELRLHDRIAATCIRMDAAHDCGAHRSVMAGGQQRRHVLSQASP